MVLDETMKNDNDNIPLLLRWKGWQARSAQVEQREPEKHQGEHEYPDQRQQRPGEDGRAKFALVKAVSTNKRCVG